MASGYTHCACRDCFDITVSNDMSAPDLCDDCLEAGCIRWKTETYPNRRQDSDDSRRWYRSNGECQRDDAYDGGPDLGGGE